MPQGQEDQREVIPCGARLFAGAVQAFDHRADVDAALGVRLVDRRRSRSVDHVAGRGAREVGGPHVPRKSAAVRTLAPA